MALRRITIQDVADACGLSRNTVSKVINGRGAVQEPTRQLVLKKALELGYFQLAIEDAIQPEIRKQNVALLTRHMPVDNHFGTLVIPAFAAQLSRAGYTLMMYELSEEELRQRSLPPYIGLEQTAAILGIELFDRDYIKRICNLGLPVLLVDGYCGAATSLMRCDIVSMENLASTMALVGHVIEKGARRIGFVGDPDHCNSFHERWIGFYTALANAGIPLDRELCILGADTSPYSDPDWLAEKIRKMPQTPDALICVNDYIALHVMTALKQIAKATGVTQKSLLGAPRGASGTSSKKTGSTAKKSDSYELTGAEKKLIDLYRAADSDTKKAATALLKGEKPESEGILSALFGTAADILGKK